MRSHRTMSATRPMAVALQQALVGPQACQEAKSSLAWQGPLPFCTWLTAYTWWFVGTGGTSHHVSLLDLLVFQRAHPANGWVDEQHMHSRALLYTTPAGRRPAHKECTVPG